MNNTAKRKNFLLVLAGYFGYVMVLFYLALGLAFLLTDVFIEYIAAGALRLMLGILLILYSIFRAFRIYKQIKETKDE